MGLFSNFKEKANSALGLGKNNDLLSVGAGIVTGGASTLVEKAEKGKLSDILLGKKAKDINPDAITNQIRSTQSKGINELNSALDKGGENIVREQVTREKAGVLSSAQDARRNAQRMMAQQGLKGSSLGLAANRSIDQSTGNSLATIDARMPGAIRDQQLKDAQTRISVGGINTAGMNFNKIEGQRSGGLMGIASALAPVAGTIAGGMMGGPAGASAGSSIGGALSGSAYGKKPVAGSYDDFYMNSVR